MTEKERAKLAIKIANEEYGDPDFGFSWKEFLSGFVIGITVAIVFNKLF